jgi:hypothetical protein
MVMVIIRQKKDQGIKRINKVNHNHPKCQEKPAPNWINNCDHSILRI